MSGHHPTAHDSGNLPRLGAVLEPVWPPEPGLRIAESQRLVGVVLGAVLVGIVALAVACLRGAA